MKDFIKKLTTILTIIAVSVLVYSWQIPTAEAAITYVSNAESAYFDVTAINNISFSVNIGTRTNGLLVVGVGVRGQSADNPDVSTVTYGGTSLSKAVDYLYDNGVGLDMLSEIWYLTNPANGTNDLVVTFAATNVTQTYVLASWYDGANQTQAAVKDQSNTGFGSEQYPSVSVTPTEDNELVVSFIISDYLTLPTAGETIINDHDFGQVTSGGSYVIQTTAAEAAMDWSYAAADWFCEVVASFKQAGSEPPPASTEPSVKIRGGVKARGGVKFR